MKCLVIGGGRIFLSHLPHILSNDSVDEALIVERNFINRLVARRLTRARVYKSLDQVDLGSVDVGIVLTPSSTHFEIAKRLLNAGVHCFVEKPMTLSARDSEELCRLAGNQGRILRVGYVYRWNPIFRYLKETVLNGDFGAPVSASLAMRGNVVGATSGKSWRSFGPGSGCLFDFGSHLVDLAVYLFGRFDFVEDVSGERVYTQGGVDRFSARLCRPIGAPRFVRVAADWSDESVRKAVVDVEIEFESATVVATPQIARIRQGETESVVSISDLDTGVSYYLRGEEFAAQWDDFLGAVAGHGDARRDQEAPDATVDGLLESIAGELT